MPVVRRLFTAAALGCGAAWLSKVALIAANGGERTDGGLIGVMWAGGMAAMLVAVAAGVALLLRGRPLWVVVPASVVSVPLAFAATGVVDGAVKSVYPYESWLRDELGLLVVAAALAVAATVQLRQLRRQHQAPAPA